MLLYKLFNETTQPYIYIYIHKPTRCDVSSFIYFCKTLCTFQTVFPSMIMSSKQYSIGYLSDRYCYPMLNVPFRAPDDGRKNRPKRAERLTEINKARNVTSHWLYSVNKEHFIQTIQRLYKCPLFDVPVSLDWSICQLLQNCSKHLPLMNALQKYLPRNNA